MFRIKDFVFRLALCCLTALLLIVENPASVTAYADAKAVTAVSGNPFWTFVQIMLWLAVIVVMAVLLIRFLAKRMQVPQKGSIDVLAARQLAPNKSVQVIQLQDKKYLVGVGEQITLLADVTDQFVSEDIRDGVDASKSFAPVLADALRSIRARHHSLSDTEKEPEL